MKTTFNTSFLLAFIAMILFSSCNQSSNEKSFDSSELSIATDEQIEKVIEDFILAEEGSTIEIPAGFYSFKTQLILDNVNNITIKGQGMDKTVLSFRDLRAGGEGVKLVGNNVTIEDLSIEDAPGDGVKAQHCDGITFRKVNVTWTNGDKSKNGTYAIYPVQCKNVLVEECIASHSKDAGIYVGQSENIIVRNCYVFGNVAGIEIENSDNAEVYGNMVKDNSGGILVFNLPGIPKADGRGTRIYDNDVIENNHINFATPLSDEPNGNTVTMIPPGTGIIVLAAKEVEIFNNRILRNKTTGVAIASYQITGFPSEGFEGWSPYTRDVYVHGNEYERPMALPDLTKEMGQLISVYNAHGKGKTQDIIYDGIWDTALSKDIKTNPMNVCFQEEGMDKLHFTLFYLMDGEKNIKSYKDYSPFVCELEIITDLASLKNM
jgi:parallel beta-helix repeat protein